MKSKMSIAAMWLLALTPLVLVAVFYRRLPDEVPMHWAFDGEINRYGTKSEVWFMGALGPVFALLFQFLPRLDPKRRSYERFHKYYEAFAVVMEAFIAAIMGIALVESFRPGTLSVGRAVSILLGLLFVFIGNMMGKIKSNFFFGVRTPWTIADPDVWNRTHRLAGRLFCLAGLITILSALLLPETALFAVLIGSMLGGALLSLLMSCVWYRQKQRRKNAGADKDA